MRKIIEIFNAIIVALTIYVAIIAGSLVIPRFFGIMPYIVQSGSMEPMIPTGSVAYINQRDRDVAVNDIITYRLGEEASIGTGQGGYAQSEAGTLVTHRVVRIDDDGNLVTKGDNNEVEDMSPISTTQVVGTYKFHIPKLGLIMAKIGNRTMMMILVGLFAMNFVTSVLLWAWNDDEKKENKPEENIGKEQDPEEGKFEENSIATENNVENSSEEKKEELRLEEGLVVEKDASAEETEMPAGNNTDVSISSEDSSQN